MKIKFSDQRMTQAVTLSAGVGQAEIDLPELSAGDAVLVRSVFHMLDVTSDAPSFTGAGLGIFAIALCGKEQVSPDDLLSLERLMWLRARTSGLTGGTSINVNSEFAFLPQPPIPRFPVVPTRELFAFHHCVNVTNAATTVIRLTMIYDVVTLTGAEQLAYLL